MDTETLHDSTVSIVDGDLEESSNNNDSLEVISSNGDVMRELRCAKELLSRVELDLACSSEKMVNLNILMMHVAAIESDLEAVDLEEDELVDSSEKVLEFDYLSEIFHSELGELWDFMTTLQNEILSAREMTSSGKHPGEALSEIEEKLHCSEESLKQSLEQMSDMRKQSTKFRRALLNFCSEEKLYEDKDIHGSENTDFLQANAKIQMQTSEQQRHILRMLEKSLATELDLEQKLTESKQAEEELKLRLLSSEREAFSLEEQMTSLLQRLFEAENAAEVLKGVSLVLVGRLQSCHFSLNCARERNSKLEINCEALNSKENGEIVDLKDKIATVESKAQGAEANCKLLEEVHIKLNEELEILRNKDEILRRNKDDTEEMVQLLERQLREADIQLKQAEASVEAGQEKQSMLYLSIRDMEIVINGLKAKVLKAEKQAEDAEDKWIVLSESNAKLNDEVSFLRRRLECLEASLNQAEEAKAAVVKDINVRANVITDLVMQLAIERESLHKQISSLMKENRFTMDKVHETHKDPSSVNVGEFDGEKEGRKHKFSPATCEKPPRGVSEGDMSSDLTDDKSKVESVHKIDAGRLGFKYTLMVILVGLVAIVTLCTLHPESCPFRRFLVG